MKGKMPSEKMLYHGTSKTDPKEIYKGKEGFNLNYSPGGMWGIANYFAVNASYSDKYSFKTSANGHKQMIYARVMIGDTIKCDPKGSLRMPPPVNSANPYDLYDSIKGETCGSDVYMIYTNKQAYPSYLITY
jgi:hypothetical protein